jgi:hypothetical protein
LSRKISRKTAIHGTSKKFKCEHEFLQVALLMENTGSDFGEMEALFLKINGSLGKKYSVRKF